MRRTIVSVAAGYFVMLVLILVLFTVVWMMLGADGLFAPGTYEATAAWVVQSVVVAFVAALGAGLIAARAGGFKAARGLAVVILFIGIAAAWPVINAWTDWRPIERPATIGMMDAMRNARQPPTVAAALPFVGALGAWLGGATYRRRRG